MKYRHLEIEIERATAFVWLNRPEVRNALDEILIAELTDAFTDLPQRSDVRVIVLGGHGKAFCAGADLHWMRRMADFSTEQNQQDAMRLATMLHKVYSSRVPVIAQVHGPAYAGGMGLAAACDVIVADPAAEFCLSEVRIGLTPATISPYVIRALGVHAARRYMLTAERFTSQEAARLGFVHELVAAGELDSAVARMGHAIASGGPEALAITKDLIDQVGVRAIDSPLMEDTAAIIAQIRASAEGKDGVSSFLEKRRPHWLSSVEVSA
jgi:methylglutaconyl-CoA hydratase